MRTTAPPTALPTPANINTSKHQHQQTSTPANINTSKHQHQRMSKHQHLWTILRLCTFGMSSIVGADLESYTYCQRCHILVLSCPILVLSLHILAFSFSPPPVT